MSKIATPSKLVDSASIVEAVLLRPRPFFSRPDVWPFTILYPIFYYYYANHYDTLFGMFEWTFVYLGTLISLHVLVWLVPHWLIDLATKFHYIRVAKNYEASHIKIVPAPNCGVAQICEINLDVYESEKDTRKEFQFSFMYQKRRFLLDDATGMFAPPSFVVDSDPTLSQFQDSKGLSGDLTQTYRLYGKNKFDVPVPTFLELFKEHAVAPFFVFQIFSIALWCMDQFWYYSLFSGFMLVSFECTTVFQRRTTLTEFQTMGIKPYAIWVYRDAKWVELQTDELLPGDLVSVARTKEGSALPCDLLLLDGSCIVNEAMLSGESTPLLKESVKLRDGKDFYQPEGLDKNSLLHGGTMALQVTAPSDSNLVAPDAGALATVTKTGFETSQGSLVRTMIFSSERISVGNKESLYFLLFLLVFAIFASRYVWIEGTKMGRKQSKLLLDCVIIITSVVPPELPMELTMAVNSSLAALGKFYIYCTEPFRIPLAGRIDICCFDKTGTLTGEDLVFEGIAGFGAATQHLAQCDSAEVPEITLYVMGSAHALVKLDDGEVVGDPMEQATLKAAKWVLSDTIKDVVEQQAPGKDGIKSPLSKVKILRRFQFSSALKRSSSISTYGQAQATKSLVSVKGAPETIKLMLDTVPANYELVYKSFTRSGSRVLALAYKHLENNISQAKVNKLNREDVECHLQFAGFIVFHCPLKEDAVVSVKMLNESSHRCIMITGDNPLTAVHVAKEVAIVEKADCLILDLPEDEGSELVWKNVTETVVIPFNPTTEPLDIKLFHDYDVCVTGHALAKLTEHAQFLDLLKRTWVYARVSPNQKEFLLTSFKDAGYNTLMCGDGTNDVGALKQAHIGIALLNGTEEGLKKMAELRKFEFLQKAYTKNVELLARFNKPPPPIPAAIAHLYPPGPQNKHYMSALVKQGIEITPEIAAAVREANKTSTNSGSNDAIGMGELLFASLTDTMEEEEAPALKLGDASVAAPFTSKLANVSAVTHIIRQGRCALVSTIQMYKILALNCLISAYSLSVIYLAGVKFGDGQATVSGLLISVCFLSISRGKPIEKLSKERPQPGIFNVYIMGSILGQFAIHIITLIYITREIYILEPRVPVLDLEKEFAPSLLNTGIFLLQLAQQVSTFAVNYQGRPFRESISENRGMYYGLIGVTFLAFSGSTEFIPELNEAMSFVKMETAFKVKLTFCLILDLGVCFAIESVLKHFFSDLKAADIAIRDDEKA
ncbi:hypothetical protein BABINDRAFT_163208 [Babjeviella inositovora NRRL Y-12698]|uniref:Cation-transporting ATPase n=1 Tax=Babjeviella inositovora NRRL Y-12698 TaxID=984486 RepID=A0A1E3QJE6_9ASCO|nr:uncharacterized protein BABINDRAFT_163208 [Babjeviella inositovora NRRL Y-12698]ODQ77821.1 hypothetical protein BABINDRAFT_163208 [Babjeviella inositovora NRRL Y-12698]